MDASVLQVLAERLNGTFSAARRGALPERALFEPEPRCTLLRAVCQLGIARELDEIEAVAALPLAIQLALRQAIWANLGRPRPAPMRWSWLPGRAFGLGLSELGGAPPEIDVRLRSPVQAASRR